MPMKWTPRRGAPLSPREREVLVLIADGSTDQEVATRLGLALRTVHLHVTSLFAKTGSRNRVHLTRYAMAVGLVSLEWIISSCDSGVQ